MVVRKQPLGGWFWPYYGSSKHSVLWVVSWYFLNRSVSGWIFSRRCVSKEKSITDPISTYRWLGLIPVTLRQSHDKPLLHCQFLTNNPGSVILAAFCRKLYGKEENCKFTIASWKQNFQWIVDSIVKSRFFQSVGRLGIASRLSQHSALARRASRCALRLRDFHGEQM